MFKNLSSIESKYHISKNGKTFLIRNAEPKDANQIIGINTAVISEEKYMLREPDEVSYTIDGEARNIDNYLKDPGCLYIVAEVGGNIAGYLEFRKGNFRRTAHSGMFSMFVLNKYRESGIGKHLLKTLIEWGQSNPSIEKISLAVFSTNERAISLYKKLGFEIEGVCPHDMKLGDGTYIDSILMYRFVK